MTKHSGRLLSALTLVFAYGCSSGTTLDFGDEDGGLGRGADAGQDAEADADTRFDGGRDEQDGSAADARVRTPCPASPTGPCVLGQVCEFAGIATTPSHLCGTVATCEPGGWSLPPGKCIYGQPNAASCPANYADIVPGTAVPDTVAQCTYQEGTCRGVNCTVDGGALREWYCQAFVKVPAECPQERPLVGSACTKAGQHCAYSPPCCSDALTRGPNIVCAGGNWEVDTGGGVSVCSCPQTTYRK